MKLAILDDYQRVALGTADWSSLKGVEVVVFDEPLQDAAKQLAPFDAVCLMVEAGVGLGIVPETTARRTGRSMAIATVDLTDAWALRELTICIRDLADLPPSARQLVDHLRGSA